MMGKVGMELHYGCRQHIITINQLHFSKGITSQIVLRNFPITLTNCGATIGKFVKVR
jgi:hypothetical protein